MRLDISLENEVLYAGCKIGKKKVKGVERLSLQTPREDALPKIMANLERIIAEADSRERIEITGRMATWTYLVTVTRAMQSFNKVCFDAGDGGPMLVFPLEEGDE